MADSQAFEWTCAALQQKSSLDKLEARGTVRLALKQSGLEARNANASQMCVVLEKVLPSELETRGVDDARDLCASMARELSGLGLDDAGGDSPEAVFQRLGG